jgi:hypothetical protein
MNIEGVEFEHVTDIAPARDAHGAVQQFHPQSRYRNDRGLPLNKYGVGPFCKFKISRKYQHSGVYILTINDEPFYVGECSNLAARFNTGYGNISPKNCFKGGQETNCRLNNLVYSATRDSKKTSIWFFQTANYKMMEAALRATMKLAWNRV